MADYSLDLGFLDDGLTLDELGQTATVLDTIATSLSEAAASWPATGTTVDEATEALAAISRELQLTGGDFAAVKAALADLQTAITTWRRDAPTDEAIADAKAEVEASQHALAAAATAEDEEATAAARERLQKAIDTYNDLITRREAADDAFVVAAEKAQAKLDEICVRPGAPDEDGLESGNGLGLDIPEEARTLDEVETTTSSEGNSPGASTPAPGTSTPSPAGTPSPAAATGTSTPSTGTSTSSSTDNLASLLGKLGTANQQPQQAAQQPAAAQQQPQLASQPQQSPTDSGALTADALEQETGLNLNGSSGIAPVPVGLAGQSGPAATVPAGSAQSPTPAAAPAAHTPGTSQTGLSTSSDTSGRPTPPASPYAPATTTSHATGTGTSQAAPLTSRGMGAGMGSGMMPMMPMVPQSGAPAPAPREAVRRYTGNDGADILSGEITTGEAVRGGTIAQKRDRDE